MKLYNHLLLSFAMCFAIFSIWQVAIFSVLGCFLMYGFARLPLQENSHFLIAWGKKLLVPYIATLFFVIEMLFLAACGLLFTSIGYFPSVNYSIVMLYSVGFGFGIVSYSLQDWFFTSLSAKTSLHSMSQFFLTIALCFVLILFGKVG